MRAALPLKLEAQEFPLGVLARLGVGRVAIHDRKEAGPKLSEALLFDGAREELLERAPEDLTKFCLNFSDDPENAAKIEERRKNAK